MQGVFVDCSHVGSSYGVLIFVHGFPGKSAVSYSIRGDLREGNRGGGIGRNWQVCWQVVGNGFYDVEEPVLTGWRCEG